MNLRSILTFISCIALITSINAQDSVPSTYMVNPPVPGNVYVGIEYAELAQNHWTINKDNYTFLIGQRFRQGKWDHFGWRVQMINVDLSPEHIQDTRSVSHIEGSRENLTGDFLSHRIYLDYYPVTFGIKYLRKWNRYILRITPVTGIGLGYGSWGFTETAYDASYRLNALQLSVPLRLNVEILDLIFIDNPFMDFFTYLWKSRDVEGVIGETTISRPEHFGISAWATVGIRLKIK